MEIKEACQFAQDISGIKFTLLSGTEGIEAFCHRYQFHDRQDYLDPLFLETMWEQLQPEEIVCSYDVFQVRFIFCSIGTEKLAVGPYCTEDFSEHDVRILFRRKGVPNLPERDFLAYRCAFPVVLENYPLHLLLCIYKSVNIGAVPNKIRNIDFDGTSTPVGLPEIKRTYGEEVNERYRLEEQYMDAIREGDHVRAINVWRELHLSVEFLKKIGSTLDISRIAAAINRTTIRIAAMQAGISPIVNDQISGESADNIRHAKSIDAIEHEHERVIREYCRAIRELKQKKYSSIVQTTLYYINHKYAEDITIERLAQEMEVTPSYLTTRFREETGTTPHQHLMQVRLQQAANALVAGTASVQKISYSVGFTDSAYFARVFKQTYGVPPTQYRKARRKP